LLSKKAKRITLWLVRQSKVPTNGQIRFLAAERDRTQGSIKLVKVADKSIVWAGSAGDKTVFFAVFRKGGQQKVAERLAKKLKEEYFAKK
jgi:hypothetical protein